MSKIVNYGMVAPALVPASLWGGLCQLPSRPRSQVRKVSAIRLLLGCTKMFHVPFVLTKPFFYRPDSAKVTWTALVSTPSTLSRF